MTFYKQPDAHSNIDEGLLIPHIEECEVQEKQHHKYEVWEGIPVSVTEIINGGQTDHKTCRCAHNVYEYHVKCVIDIDRNHTDADKRDSKENTNVVSDDL